MKKQPYILIGVTSFLFVAFLFRSIFKVLDLEWTSLFQDLEKTEKVVFLGLMFSLALAFLLVLFWTIVDEISKRRIQANLKRLLAGKDIESLGDADLDASFKNLSGKLGLLTEAIQKADNQALVKEEEIVEKERKRIARDLHDTVSQELFAANMILSGVAAQALELEKSQIQQQLNGVSDILGTAQNDLRVLLLHLRPTELEGKSLVEGMEMIFRELKEKSNLTVVFHHNDVSIPKDMEEHLFRIVQEIVSNTLKHARAQQMDVFLHQEGKQLHLRMVDDGIGFEQEKLERLSYGLKNIQERVEDMAGTIKIRTSPQKGVAVDIRVPLLVKDKNEKETV